MKKQTSYFLLLIILTLVFLSGCQQKEPIITNQRSKAVVNRVIDGDTIVVKLNGKLRRVRFIGVDTPETKKPNTPVMYYGPEASAYTKKRLSHQKITLEWDVDKKDKYNRLLAYVWLKKELFNRTLVQKGYARVETIQPDVKYADLFIKDQKEARKKQRGIWKNYDAAFDHQYSTH